jgi:hypothetical protein
MTGGETMKQVSQANRRVSEIGWQLMEGVRLIDLACNRLRHGVEGGLCNVKFQFDADVADGIHPPPGKRVKEEDAISWMLAKRTVAKCWGRYPGSRKTCDLVIQDPEPSLWVEVKLAWKRWFNCDGTFGSSSAYLPYLYGSKHKTHSFGDDFDKVLTLAPPSAHVGVLLVGFDGIDAPMTVELGDFMKPTCESGWIVSHMMWPDRRSAWCRINCWFFQHLPAEVS